MPKILLVEDNPLNRDMLSRRLMRRHFQVISAENGSQALTLAREQQPDLVLMDLRLPDISGWDVTRQLKADKATSAIPIIALTAHAMEGHREQALAAGCDDYDTKPIEFERLVGKIKALLEKES